MGDQAAVLETIKLSRVSYEICSFVNQHGGQSVTVSQSKLASSLNCDHSLVFCHINRLVVRGLLKMENQRGTRAQKISPILSLVVPFERLEKGVSFVRAPKPASAAQLKPEEVVKPDLIDQLTAALQERLQLKDQAVVLERENHDLKDENASLRNQLESMRGEIEHFKNLISFKDAVAVRREKALSDLLGSSPKRAVVDGQSGLVVSLGK